MTITEYAELVRSMRAAQARYFKERTQEVLREAKRLERDVDRETGRIVPGDGATGEESRTPKAVVRVKHRQFHLFDSTSQAMRFCDEIDETGEGEDVNLHTVAGWTWHAPEPSSSPRGQFSPVD